MRALAPAPQSVSAAVAEIVATVRDGGDRALRELVARFDTGGAAPPDSLRVAPEELDAGLLDDDVRAGLEVAIANVALVADAGVGADVEVDAAAGPSRRAARGAGARAPRSTCPGGRAPYPSSVVMGVVTARAAGVEEVVVLTPPPIDPVIRGACALCGVHEVYAMGGAHGIAALAYGTETIERVDVIAGPGSLIVQEAKRQVSDSVGIDGFYGPSDVLVLADGSRRRAARRARPARPGRARAGRAGRRRQRLRGVPRRARRRSSSSSAPERPASEPGGVRARARRTRCATALAFAEAFAPEHLELVGAGRRAARAPRALARAASSSARPARRRSATTSRVRTTACRPAARRASPPACRRATSAAASARCTSARRRAALAAAGAPIARAEGFDVHAESMEARVGENPPS